MTNTPPRFASRCLTFLAVGALGLAPVACGKKSKSKAEDNKPQLPVNGDVKGTALTADALQGYWISGCAQPGSGLFALSFAQRQVHFTKDEVTVIVGAFDKGDCAPESMTKMLILSGKYSLGGVTGPGTAFDVEVQDISMLPLSEEAAAKLNASNGTCGFTDWKALEPKPLLEATKCDSFYTAGIVKFDLLGKDGDKLLLGAYYESDDAGASADKRPKKLAVGEPHTKTDKPVLGDVEGGE